MTGSQTITTEHLRALLDTQDGASIIGLVEGDVRIIEPDARDADENHGAIEVISQEALRERLGASGASEDQLRDEAEALTAITQQLGG